MKTRFSDASVSVLVAGVAAIVAVTCAAGTPQGRSASADSADSPTPSSQPADAPMAAASVSARGVVDAAGEAGPDGAQPAAPDAARAARPPALLERFHAALRALRAGEREGPVRIAWLGDSHTAADFWTHAVRKPLQQRFGNGGPGFVMLGLAAYRHDGVKVLSEGTWRREPSAPAGSSRSLDGVFGLGGQRVIPSSQDARASISLSPGAVEGDARFTVVYRAKAGDKLRLTVRGGDSKVVGESDGQAPSGSPLRHVALRGKGSAAFDLAVAGGAPQVFGVYVESEKPGAVLDTLGINGARAATALAWEAAAWQAELRAREPSLVVLAYGTNEAAGAWAVDRYESSLAALAGRVRAAVPDADCLVVGPPDAASASGGSRPRVVEHDAAARGVAEKAGCAYFSAFEAMGGEGSHSRWAKETPSLAGADGIHLKSAGYERLGARVAEALLVGYGD